MKKIIKKFLPLLLFFASFGLVQADSNALENKYPKAIAFIKQELTQYGINPEEIQIESYCEWQVYRTELVRGKHCLRVPEWGHLSLSMLEGILMKNELEWLLPAYQWVIGHEANHIRLDHTTKAALLHPFGQVTHKDSKDCPLLTYAGIYSAVSTIGVERTRKLCDQYYESNPLICSYRRTLEQEADDNVRNDLAVLKGGIEYLSFYKDVLDSRKSSHGLFDRIKQYIQPLFDTHPTFDARIAKIQARIKALEATQQKA